MARQNHGVRICSFEAVALTPADLSSYEAFKRKVLLAGRFSVFEASENPKKAALFTQLCRDSSIIADTACGFPWTTVRAHPHSGASHD